ncbi:MAG TPA: pentapeptide repeat-containing protein [Thermoanaerobaculia bacterium]|nr:pentapeptide repeat-containing protein [Thermoanaerobaculia bacterium]
MGESEVIRRTRGCLERCAGIRAELVHGDDTQRGFWGKFPFDRMASLQERCGQVWNQEFGTSDLADLDLGSADFSGLLFAGVSFERCSFAEAKLDGTRWIGVPLKECDFTGAALRNAAFVMANTPGSKFRTANVSGAYISYFMADETTPVDFSDANLTAASLQLLGDVPLILSGADLTGVTVSGSPESLAKMRNQLTEAQRAALVAAAPKRCFIATAACGDEEAEEVKALRHFRDDVLSRSPFGRHIIHSYESVSPPLAAWIARGRLRRSTVRVVCIVPAARLVKALLTRAMPVLILAALLAGCGRESARPAASSGTQSSNAASAQPYVDPKGLFRVTPPDRWRLEEYPREQRSKAAFHAPAARVDLRVLVSSHTFRGVDDLLADFQRTAEQIRADSGDRVEIERTTFLNRDAVRRSGTFRGLRVVGYAFLDGPHKHDIQYSAPERLFEENFDAAHRSMQTYEVTAGN